MSLDGNAGQIVSITARPAGFSPELQLLAPNGEFLARDGNWLAPHSSAQLVALLPADGRYLVAVNDVFLYESGTYRLTAHAVTPTPLDTTAPGEGVLTVDGPAAEVWSFDAAAGQVANVVVTSDTFEPRYCLISPAGDVILAGSRRATVPLPVDGRYLLGVMVGGTFGLAATEGGAYEVSAQEAPVTPMAADTAGTGVLDGNASEVWSFHGAAGQVVSVRVAWEEFGYLRGAIISPTGRRLAYDGSEARSLHLVAGLPADGRYLVRLETRRTRAPVPYEVAARVVREARPLEMDRPVVELFSGDGPTVRSWEFDGIAGRVVNVTADCDAFEPRLRRRRTPGRGHPPRTTTARAGAVRRAGQLPTPPGTRRATGCRSGTRTSRGTTRRRNATATRTASEPPPAMPPRPSPPANRTSRTTRGR